MTPQQFSWEIEKLLQEQAQPIQGLSDDEKDGIAVSYTILESNFSELVEVVEGGFDIRRKPVIRSSLDEEEVIATQTEVTRLTHNYLSSLYSFNEHIRVLANRVTDNSIDMKRGDFLCLSSLENQTIREN